MLYNLWFSPIVCNDKAYQGNLLNVVNLPIIYLFFFLRSQFIDFKLWAMNYGELHGLQRFFSVIYRALNSFISRLTFLPSHACFNSQIIIIYCFHYLMLEFHVGKKECYGIKQRTNNLFCASVEKCMILILPTDFIVHGSYYSDTCIHCMYIVPILNPLSPHDASFYILENRLNFPTTKGFGTKIPMKLFYQYVVNFFTFSPISSHLHPLQVENCDSNSRLEVDEDDNDNGKFRLERIDNNKMWRFLSQP